MVVGALLIELHFDEGNSLKDKRRVVRGLLDALRARFHVSAAEVDDLDLLRRATIGVSVVSGGSTHAESVLSSVLEFVESKSAARVEGVFREVLRVGEDE